jgi:hypothetical protein
VLCTLSRTGLPESVEMKSGEDRFDHPVFDLKKFGTSNFEIHEFW